MTTKDLERLKKEGKIRGWKETGKGVSVQTRSKYGNERVELDGIWFDSRRECKRYIELRFLLKAGEIKYLERQVEFELNEGGAAGSLIYRADFVYETKGGLMVVEDSKGCRTREYKKKRRLMKQIHGIEIFET
jgi:hypothetical protein